MTYSTIKDAKDVDVRVCEMEDVTMVVPTTALAFASMYNQRRKLYGPAAVQAKTCANCAQILKQTVSEFIALYDDDVLEGHLARLDTDDPEGLFEELI